jgi:hypothetical protein
MCCALIVVSLPSLKLLLKYRHMNSEYDFSGSLTRDTDMKSAEHTVQMPFPSFVELGEDRSQVSVKLESQWGPGVINGYQKGERLDAYMNPLSLANSLSLSGVSNTLSSEPCLMA